MEGNDNLSGEVEVRHSNPTRLPNIVLDSIAHLASECVPVGDISKVTGIPVTRIVKLFEGGNKEFDKCRREWQSNAMTTTTGHRRKMIGMLDDAHGAVEVGLGSSDKKAAADIAFRLFKDLGLGEQSPGAVSFNFQQNNQTNHYGPKEIEGTTVNILEVHAKTKELGKFAGDIGDFTKHLLKGTDALPTPEAQTRVIDVEALPPVEESQKDAFNLTELDPDD